MTILSTYDAVEQKHTRSYIDPCYKKLYSNEISYRKYYSFGKRYNAKFHKDDYYLILSNDTTDDRNWHSVTQRKNMYNFTLSPIWSDSSLQYLKETTDIYIRKEDEDEESVVYYLDI